MKRFCAVALFMGAALTLFPMPGYSDGAPDPPDFTSPEPGGSTLRTVIAGVAISVTLVSLVFLIRRKKSRSAQSAQNRGNGGEIGPEPKPPEPGSAAPEEDSNPD